MSTAAEVIDGALVVAVMALVVAIAVRIRMAVRRRRLFRIARQAEEWVASLAAPTPSRTPAGPSGFPTPVGSAGSTVECVR